ncbi:MAG TPA: OmpA family protein, partial [Oligoflexia bacterium]|nr:OmpA family protein [Oligoflexia bacterium]
LPACSPFSSRPAPGPDKQSEGTLFGAASGAGAGVITAAQVGAATGPAAWIGAGLGGIFGLFSGLGTDLLEEDQIRRERETQCMRQTTWAQNKLAEHYARRLELHPSRDIFPADWFFAPDSAQFQPGAELLVQMLAELTQRRMPWSRIMIAAYNTASDPESAYAKHVTKKRAEAIAVAFISSGFEPRRVLAQGVVVPEPILVDPDDNPGRYRQAIELIPVDY